MNKSRRGTKRQRGDGVASAEVEGARRATGASAGVCPGRRGRGPLWRRSMVPTALATKCKWPLLGIILVFAVQGSAETKLGHLSDVLRNEATVDVLTDRLCPIGFSRKGKFATVSIDGWHRVATGDQGVFPKADRLLSRNCPVNDQPLSRSPIPRFGPNR